MRAKLGSTLLAGIVGVSAFAGTASAQALDWATCGKAEPIPSCSATVTSCCSETAVNLNIGQTTGEKAIIIPMDRCHQRISSVVANIFKHPGTGAPDAVGNGWCEEPSPANADGMFFAYGLVYRMMQRGVPVWWIVNPGKTNSTVAGYETGPGSQRYVQTDIDLWITHTGTAIPTAGSLLACGVGCGPVSLLADDLTVASTYTKTTFPLRGSVFLIAGSDTDADGTSDRVEFNTFWGTYGDGAPGAGRTCAPGQDCYDFTDVTLYEINAGAEVKWKNYATANTLHENSVPVGIKIDYQPPRIARVASGGNVSELWLQAANLNDTAASTCKLGVFSPTDAVVCDLTYTDLTNNSLVAGQFGWAWFDGGAGFASCSRGIQMIKTFLTSVPGFTTSGNVLINDTRLSEVEGCASHQLLGRSGLAANALTFGTVANEAVTTPYLIRYPTNLFSQYGDLPLQFAASSTAHWTSSTTNGYNSLFAGSSNTLKRLITRERAQFPGTNEVCGDTNANGTLTDATERPHSNDVWPTANATTCDVNPATAGVNGDREDMAAYGRLDNDQLNGIVFYVPGNSLNTTGVRAELRIVLNSIIATPTTKYTPSSTAPREITRAAPVVPIIGGVDAIVQGSYVYFDPPGTASVVNNNTEAASFTFPYRIGHMRAVQAASPTTIMFDTGCNAILNTAFPTSNFACPAGTGGIPATTNTYTGGCTFPKVSGNADCRTIFTNAASGDRRTDTTYTYFNNEIADTTSTTAATIRSLIKTGTNLSDAAALTIVQRVIAGYPDGSGGYMAVLGGVDRSTTAVIQVSEVAGTGPARPLMAYFGAADGMLHAVCAEVNATKGCDVLGRELWAFLPRTMLPHLRTNTARIDGSPRVLDAYIDPDGAGSAGTQWRTILVFHTGMGDYSQSGRQPAIYALDITNPSQPKLLWEHSVTSAGASSLGVGLTLSAGGTTIAGVTKYLVWAQTNNLGSSGPGSVVTSIDLASGAQYDQAYFQFSPNPRVNTKDPVVYSGIPGGTVPVDLTGSAKVTDLVFTDLYGQLWLIDPATLDSRNSSGPLFKMSEDYYAVGAKPAIYSQGSAQYAVFATGGYTDPSNTTWPIACCASSNGSSCNTVPPTPTVCSQYNGSTQIFPKQMALAIKIDSSVTTAIAPPSAACDSSPSPDPVAAADLPDCTPTQILFRRDLGRDERSSSQALIVGTDIFLSTDTDNANRAAYGAAGTSTGKLYTFGSLGQQAANPTTIIAGVAGPAAGNETSGTKNIYAGRFGNFGSGTTTTTGTNVTANPSGTVFRKLWLRTE